MPFHKSSASNTPDWQLTQLQESHILWEEKNTKENQKPHPIPPIFQGSSETEAKLFEVQKQQENPQSWIFTLKFKVIFYQSICSFIQAKSKMSKLINYRASVWLLFHCLQHIHSQDSQLFRMKLRLHAWNVKNM